MKPNCNVAPLIERYFTERLMRQRNVSAITIASYRYTFGCCSPLHRRGSEAPSITLDDLDVHQRVPR
jgi:hypothetical protein